MPKINLPSKKQLEKVIKPLSDKELKELETEDDKIKKLMDYFDQYGIDYSKFKPEHLSFIVNKNAYPNYDKYMYIPTPHDTNKWLMAAKNIYYKQKNGLSYKNAIKEVVGNWKKMEIYDFLNWLKFYQEGAQMKYKFAQVWYQNDQPGYFLHIKPDKPEEPQVDFNKVQEEKLQQEEKRNIIEKQRQKIIGRLDSAEKLLRSHEGRTFAGNELEQLIEAIYALKKKIYLVNKISTSIKLYEDMIVRQGNVLKRSGFDKAANILYALAQTPGQSAESAKGQQFGGKIPMNATPPPDPSGAGQVGAMSGFPATIPNTPNINTPVDGDQNTFTQPSVEALKGQENQLNAEIVAGPALVPQEAPQSEGIKGFIERMNSTESNSAIDSLEVEDEESTLEITEKSFADDLIAEAQAALSKPTDAPGVPPKALEDVPIADSPSPDRGNPVNLPTNVEDKPVPADKPIPIEENLEVSEDDLPINITNDNIPTGGQPVSNFDSKIDELMKNVTINDVVAELEVISRDYKTREQPRRLSYVDMMLDSLGLASMFPSLSEAQNKALEATNYISTRVDDILAKLRGAIASQEKSQIPQPDRPEVVGIKNKLQSEQDKEQKRKQMRKEQENADLESNVSKSAPNVEMGELAPPKPAATAI